ncbi:hypothetical protein KCU65_g131, partial [Aureobasidium melanogenum]
MASGTSIHSLSRVPHGRSKTCMNVTPGSTKANAPSTLTSRIFDMFLPISRPTDPGTLGAAPPYPTFLPILNGQTGISNSLHSRMMACTSGTLRGATTAELTKYSFGVIWYI